MQKRLFYIMLTAWTILTVCLQTAKATTTLKETLPDAKGLSFSLLTCTPGKDVYAHFGHTAILMEDRESGEAVVYNYGCFDSSQEHFVVNFMKGDTNYKLDKETREFFLWRYSDMGVGVTEQHLNLTQAEARRLKALLAENVKEKNQTYLYNWLYDNCTERARNIIEQAVDGQIEYEKEERNITVRQELHEKLQSSPWLQLGIDLLLGYEIDRPAPRRLQMFLPDCYQDEIDSATIIMADGTRRPLVRQSTQMLKESPENYSEASGIRPEWVFLLLLVGVCIVSARDVRRGHPTLWLDLLLYTAQSLIGIVVFYLYFFSKHPATSSNWQVILFNPLPILFAAIFTLTPLRKTLLSHLPINNYLPLCLLIVVNLYGQSVNTSVWLMALTLQIRAIIQFLCLRKAFKDKTVHTSASC